MGLVRPLLLFPHQSERKDNNMNENYQILTACLKEGVIESMKGSSMIVYGVYYDLEKKQWYIIVQKKEKMLIPLLNHNKTWKVNNIPSTLTTQEVERLELLESGQEIWYLKPDTKQKVTLQSKVINWMEVHGGQYYFDREELLPWDRFYVTWFTDKKEALDELRYLKKNDKRAE